MVEVFAVFVMPIHIRPSVRVCKHYFTKIDMADGGEAGTGKFSGLPER
jgi:hypothetical protein